MAPVAKHSQSHITVESTLPGTDSRRTMEFAAAIYASSFTGRQILRGEITTGNPFYAEMQGSGAPWLGARR